MADITVQEHAEVNKTTTRPDSRQFENVQFYERKPAGFWVRFWAYLIDLIVISGVTSVLFKPVFALLGIETSTDSWFAPFAILSSILFYAYFVLMTKFFSQTVGKMILGVKVVSLKEDRLDWGTLLFREWIGRIISVTVLPLYFIVGFTPLKQGVHDFFADTTVVHEESFRKRSMMRKVRHDERDLQEGQSF